MFYLVFGFLFLNNFERFIQDTYIRELPHDASSLADSLEKFVQPIVQPAAQATVSILMGLAKAQSHIIQSVKVVLSHENTESVSKLGSAIKDFLVQCDDAGNPQPGYVFECHTYPAFFNDIAKC